MVDVQEDDLDEEQQQNDGDPAEDANSSRIERYCARVEGTAAWGGQIELQALACVLKRGIRVYSANMDVVDVGTEYTGKAPWTPLVKISVSRTPLVLPMLRLH